MLAFQKCKRRQEEAKKKTEKPARAQSGMVSQSSENPRLSRMNEP